MLLLLSMVDSSNIHENSIKFNPDNINNDNNINVDNDNFLYKKFLSLIIAIFVSLLYPGIGYLFCFGFDRSDPNFIKRSFISNTISCLIAYQILKLFHEWSNSSLNTQNPATISPYFIHKHYDDNWILINNCIIKPLLLIITLFIGPICYDLMEMFYYWKSYFRSVINFNIFKFLFTNYYHVFSNYLITIRTLIVAPFCEELFFRAIIIAILIPFWSNINCILISSILFSSMHLHNYLIRNLLLNLDDITLNESIIQLLFTTLFGIIASLNYLHTGHLITPFLLHSFCNLNGLPRFHVIFTNRFFSLLTIIGFLIWLYNFITLLILI